MKNIFLYLTLLVFSKVIFGQTQIPVPAKAQKKPILIYGGIIHVGNGFKIDNGYVLIEKGKILKVGNTNEISFDTTKIKMIQANGNHIYPGFISTNNTLGLREIDAVRATRDFNETGSINPHVRALIAFNTESRVTTTVRSNGVLITQATPRGGLISGQSSVMQLDGWNWEDAQIKADDGIHLNWPKHHAWDWKQHKIAKNKNLNKQIEALDQLFIDAKGYKVHQQTNLKLEAMQGLFSGKKRLYIHVAKAKEIIAAITFAKKYTIQQIVLVGASESYLIPDFIVTNNVSVILQRVQSLPLYEDVPVLTPYEIASILEKYNVLYCISYTGDMEAMNTRNLPFGAGITVAYGVNYEKAVASITLKPAQILGIDKQYGSIEKGKSATLIISEGDALDIKTNSIIYALIDGRSIDLNNHQKELFKKFDKKYSYQK